jgi:uncharacterized NAD(P)/FAD-binding protein YdhS
MSPAPIDAAVIGGGFSATALAVELARRAPAPFRCAIFSRAPLGPGTAYAPQSAALLMNGPVRAMSAVPGDDRHLARYLVDEADDALICRARYGAYLRATAAAALAAHRGITHVRDEIADIEPTDGGFRLHMDDGHSLVARNVVFAVGNLPPNDAFLPAAVRDHAGYAGDPWSASVERFDHARDVAIIGTRLTAMDTIALLDEVAYRGRVHLISRHALIPAIEDSSVRGLDPATLALDTATPRALLHSLRRAAARYPGDWRAIVEALRPVTPAIWMGWNVRERRRFLRHLQSMWAVHRYRVPPATHGAFARMRAEGRVLMHRGHITGARCTPERITLTIEDRGERYEIGSGYVINCTGPNGDLNTVANPLVRNAIVRGLMRPDPLRLGADVTPDYRLIAGDGSKQSNLFAIGPLLRGLWYETTAVGEIRKHAGDIVGALIAQREALSGARNQAVAL